MYYDLPRAARFWSVLLAIDHDLAKTTRKGASACGRRLHAANYLPKPYGTLEQIPRPQCLRFSFCCNRDGCRKRMTTTVGALPRPEGLSRRHRHPDQHHSVETDPPRVRELSQRFGADR